MFENLRLDDLKLLHKCFQRNPDNIVPVVQAFNQYILGRGIEIIENPTNTADVLLLVQKLLDLQEFTETELV